LATSTLNPKLTTLQNALRSWDHDVEVFVMLRFGDFTLGFCELVWFWQPKSLNPKLLSINKKSFPFREVGPGVL
jgi:hypothetical protein